MRESIDERNTRLFGVVNPVALVTGSTAPRVGRAIASYLALEGFRLVLHGHEREPVVEQTSFQPAHVVGGEIESEENVARWTAEVQERVGRVDLLVNSAAIWQPRSLEKTLAADFQRNFEVNALGTALTCKHFGLLMSKQVTGGAIINISDWAVQRPYRDFSAYFPSKAAVDSITKCMAVELASRNPRIRVNAIQPGPVLLADSVDEAKREQIERDSLLKRSGTAHDVAAAVLFLATSPFVTGVCLPVDGGRSIHAGQSADAIAHPDV